ncbi:similar to Saccharomyces cerevisiae YDR257C RKM4 Ribosomal lysine methyltransferase specific for monomethylation of Rpl42ap and Rpl42bp (lysine 55) [Maudiozyma saulgeensis]|uniref:Ribosomal lysine N-methyltransferase 4 n=1 Tax=Maudiozyma saulgeensis TaxID=1789683 RepID=A0A1X7R9F2_9SACH|nr:similar to Saccharomyces cerevisiae YDR257C RKM4 Ribosomal lysine methyltransferase specific for monomethylation of Rpl42ap and Rpl42bp (lysine 55) [Kazachstania saulgeensis]
MDQFNKDIEEFSNWLSDDADVKVSPKISIVDLRSSNEGRAVIANEQIAKDEILFEIPFKLLINIETSQINKDHPDIHNELNRLGQWNGLIVCLLYEWEWLHEKSKWWPYMKVLPTSGTLNGLMYWNEDQLKKLEPSLVLERIGKEGAKQMYETIMKFIRDNGLDKELGETSWESFLRVASTIMSYSFDVEKIDPNGSQEKDSQSADDEDEPETISLKSMVPFADTLNADTHKCNAHLEYDKDSLKMRAINTIDKGGQVYNIYGEHPNSEILRRYGYVEMEGSAFDFGEVLLQNIKDSLKSIYSMDEEFMDWILTELKNDQMIETFFEDEEIVLDSYDCYISGEILTELVLFLQIITTFCSIPDVKDQNEVDRLATLNRVTKKCVQLVEGGTATQGCSEVWKLAVENRLKEYPEDCLNTAVTFDDNDSIDKIRESMAKIVLRSECQALDKCMSSISQQYKIINDEKLLNNILKRKSNPNDNRSPNSKRQKR